MKLLNLMIPLTMMALVLVDCKGDHTNNEDDGNNGPPTVVVVERPDMAIELDEAIALYQNYGANRVKLIEDHENEEVGEVDNFQATRSLTFNYKELRQYLDYVEQEAKKADTEILGLRVYLGQYDIEGRHPNSGTVFFNPTMKKGDNEVAFAIQNQNGNPTAVPVGQLQEYYLKIGKIKTPGKANLVLVQDDDDITSLAANRGGKRPPPSTDDDDYDDGNNN
ncbi:hypothetical protein [uncultured Dokdonia sp.]|uniref:hypothetical protein n=1 Tax=uncultured Dokdonia sp. TaxID=575653 RepID=UPI00261FB07C|nr:hypothetical protein [uncultured Dokdonia sp.]